LLDFPLLDFPLLDFPLLGMLEAGEGATRFAGVWAMTGR
jgi:hypothetical protein